jgi:hypothetical protein
MGLKAGWLALFAFVWIIGAFLGSTFDYHNTSDASGVDYTTGTATFTYASDTVTGIGTAWDATMEDGVIKSNTDAVWYKIETVNNATSLTLYSPYAETGGVGVAYTMAASPGWAGEGTGGYEQSPVTSLEYLLNIRNATQKLPLLGDVPLPIPNGEYFKTAFKVVTWQFSFLYDTDGNLKYGLFYWVFIAPFAIMGVLSMLILVYGIITGNITFG